LQAAGTLTRDAYIKAVHKACETIEHNKLIASKELEKEAKKYWKSLARGTSSLGSRLGSAAVKRTSELGSRLGSAAKAALDAAWKEITAPNSDSESEPKQSSSQVVSHAPEATISEENHQQTLKATLSQPASENKLHSTHSEDELRHLSLENQVKEDQLPEN
jgi:vancomycin resistance protein YoaR